MTINVMYSPRPARRGRVIALHCSGAGASQWCELALADEAARTIALIGRREDKVHLVGRFYVALNVALARPDRIASMALYEPSGFHLLSETGEAGATARATIVRRVCKGVITGDCQWAAGVFVDYSYWAGAWKAMRPSVRDAPPAPTRVIAERLAQLLAKSRPMVVGGAGHMGPLTHAPEVSAFIVQHISTAGAEANRQASRHWRPRSLANILEQAPQPTEVAS